MSVMETTSGMLRGVTGLPRRIFGTRNDRLLKYYRRVTEPTGSYESDLRGDYDERFARRVAEAGVDELPEEERPARLQEIRTELSDDLRREMDALREIIEPHSRPLEDWWRTLDPPKQMEEYYRKEYRGRDAKVIEALDAEGLNQQVFAILREASRRAQAHRHFDCQLIGGRVLYEGRIAEMRTGEGKTIVCHLSAMMNVLRERKVHIITVNDYLVRRDAEFARPIFELLGVSVGYIQSQVDPGGREGIRSAAYACDITYGTNSEFGFDYLRDNMKNHLEEQVQGNLDYVIVDEVDSILIDEARTPLIISGPTADDVTRYSRADKVAEELVRRQRTWDQKLKSTIERFDGDTHNIPKLEDAMRILGYRKRKDKDAPPADESEEDTPALGPDFLTDDHVDAIQQYQHTVLQTAPTELYRRFFIVQTERKQASITHEGVTIAQDLLDMGSLYSGANMEWPHLIENSLRAHKVYQRDRDYVVQDGQIVIVDPFTGRLMIGRQWSDGLHQAVEAKESVRVKEETQTLATITIQNFIKLYRVRAGMTGTAMTEATEFDKIYHLDVVEIPTNRPVNRLDHNDKMYRNVEQKYNAIVEEIHEVHRRGRPSDPFLLADVFQALRPLLVKLGEDTSRVDEAMEQFNSAEMGDKKVIRFMCDTYDEVMGDLVRGRPVLVGTTSVEYSEKLSRLLDQRYGIEHEVLNAKNHAREADIVAKAGFTTPPTKARDKTPVGNVTIATNMAGRGTDIKLGPDVVYEKCRVPETLPEGATPSDLYPAGVTKCCIKCEEYDPATNCAHCFKPKVDPRFPDMGCKVCSITAPCGLHIIGTERHEARRIDNQLRGRAGRQGDPGSSRFSLSLEDDLLKLFMPDWMLKMMERLGFTDGSSLEDKRLSKGIEKAQRKVEERNFSTRKHLLEWDEPMDFQRKEFYLSRQRILEERELPALILGMIDNAIESKLDELLDPNYARACIAAWCTTQLELEITEDAINIEDLEFAERSIRTRAIEEAHDAVRTSIGEYIDPDESPKSWDVGGLSQWASRLFNASLSQNQLRKMQPKEIEDALYTAAEEYYGNYDLSPIAVYLEEHYALRTLSDWAQHKFNVILPLDDLIDASKTEIEGTLKDRVRSIYHERELAYPVEACLERAYGTEEVSEAFAAEWVTSWANNKFRVGWTSGDVMGKSPAELRDELVAIARAYYDQGIVDEVDEAVSDKSDEEALAWAQSRFGRAFNRRRYDRFDGSRRDALIDQGREMIRWELTRLEHYVLLRIHDQAWKDHLLEMDHLKDAIAQRPLGGDQTHPQSQYAIEGRGLFKQMWARIAERVTDVIFKVRASSRGDADEQEQPPSAPALSFRHGDATGAGFVGMTADQRAAMRAQGDEGKVETIRREQPKVGRNDPCPCGSGKKYKQCHGRRT